MVLLPNITSLTTNHDVPYDIKDLEIGAFQKKVWDHNMQILIDEGFEEVKQTKLLCTRLERPSKRNKLRTVIISIYPTESMYQVYDERTRRFTLSEPKQHIKDAYEALREIIMQSTYGTIF